MEEDIPSTLNASPYDLVRIGIRGTYLVITLLAHSRIMWVVDCDLTHDHDDDH